MLNFDSFKKKLKKNKLIFSTYNNVLKVLFSLDPIIPMKLPIKLFYRITMGKKLDLSNPKGLNEKIQWLKIYYRDPLYVKCTDKYSVREFVKSKNCEDTLNELYGVYKSADDIDFEKLPNKFALKATHGCSNNIICDDKDKLDINEAKSKIRKWLKEKSGTSTGEKHYQFIEPRIVIEKNLAAEDGTLPIDYKIYCFNGKPYCVCVYSDRDRITLKTNRCYYDFNWNPLDIVTKDFYTDPKRFKRPESLDYMYEVAEKLSAPFPFVRVDLYEYSGKVVFGELTFTPTGGFGKAFTEEANLEFGKLIKLPERSKTKDYI